MKPLELDEGDPCPVCQAHGYDGRMEIRRDRDRYGGCSCHISAPCSYCVNSSLICSECRQDPDEIEAKIASLESAIAVGYALEAIGALCRMIWKHRAEIAARQASAQALHRALARHRVLPGVMAHRRFW